MSPATENYFRKNNVLKPLDCRLYRLVHGKPARRLVDQRGRRSRTLCRKLNKCKCKVLTGWRRCWKWSPCTSMHFCARCSILSYTWCKSAVSIQRI